MEKIISGKVREVYEVSEDRLAIVTTDRISAFDVILPTLITDKGRVLNSLSSFWFGYTKTSSKTIWSQRTRKTCQRSSGPGIRGAHYTCEEAQNDPLRVHRAGVSLRLHVEGVSEDRRLLWD